MILLLLACGEGGEEGDKARDAHDDTAQTDDSGTGPVELAAEAVLEKLRSGGTLQELSRSDGWPVATTDGYLFVSTDLPLVAGDFDDWAGTALTEDEGFSWIVLEVDPGAHYKFTDGTTWIADPWSRSYTYDENGEMSLVAPSEAHLDRHFGVTDGTLAERTVRVWVPAEAPDHVLYVHDGQNLFDPQAIWGGWHLQDSAPAGMLLVGIDNTADRMEEYTHVEDFIDGTRYGGDGDAYAAMIQDVVRPFIRDSYGEDGPVGTMGSSLGGLISFHIADRYPGEYAFAASLSGTMGWGSIEATNETMIQRYEGAGHRGTALYLDSGGYGSTCADGDGDGTNDDDYDSADNYCENIQLQGVLEQEGYLYDTDLWHWHEPDATHDEAAWAARVWRPLEIFAGL